MYRRLVEAALAFVRGAAYGPIEAIGQDTRMQFARKVWHLLVAIKDGLVLLLMLLFFAEFYSQP